MNSPYYWTLWETAGNCRFTIEQMFYIIILAKGERTMDDREKLYNELIRLIDKLDSKQLKLLCILVINMTG